MVNNLSLFRGNPIGLENQLRLGYAYKLYGRDASRLLRDNFVWLGAYLRTSPASLRAAAMVEVQPLSILNLRFSVESLRFFGNFTFLQSRPSAADELADSHMKAHRTGPLANYSGGGIHMTFEPLLQVKVGPIVIRNRAFFGRFDMQLERGDRVFYEATLDVAVPAQGWVFANDFDVLYQRSFGTALLTTGVRVTSVVPQYDERDVLPGAPPDGIDNSHHRAGLLAAYTLWDDGYTAFNKPTVLLISSWYLKHRYRTGADVNQMVPYVVVGLAFQSDVLAGR
ncbi:MAG: hypothetical protein EXR79_05420 [Myxococcales bacterium]|nr:hypothetical protein [Myxococcales bacterium]